MNKQIKKIHLLFLVGFILIAVGGFLLFTAQYRHLSFSSQILLTIDAELQKSMSTADVFSDLHPHILEITKRIGPRGTIMLIETALSRKLISFGNCHSLLHLAGHAAYRQYEDVDRAVEVGYGRHCQDAYWHGVEAQIVDEEPIPFEKLKHFCILVHERVAKDYLCYHGAGHAFMGLSLLNLKSALARCEILGEKVKESPVNCYHGVFSEYGARALGYDGDTGLRIPGEPAVKISFAHPLEFCQTIDIRYQESCASQLTKIVFHPDDVARSFLNCVWSGYKENIQAICVRFSAFFYADAFLAIHDTLEIPSSFYSLSRPLQNVFIQGAMNAFHEAALSGVKKDARSFCGAFTVLEEQAFCRTF